MPFYENPSVLDVGLFRGGRVARVRFDPRGHRRQGRCCRSGLAVVYAVFTGTALVILAIIVAVNSHFRTRIGLGITLALEIAPWAFLVYEAARRILARMS